MTGKIHRVTYNHQKCSADLHMDDGTIKSVPMSIDEWESLITGDLIENIKKYYG